MSPSSNTAAGEARTRYGAIRAGEVAEAEALALTAGPYVGREPDRSKSITGTAEKALLTYVVIRPGTALT